MQKKSFLEKSAKETCWCSLRCYVEEKLSVGRYLNRWLSLRAESREPALGYDIEASLYIHSKSYEKAEPISDEILDLYLGEGECYTRGEHHPFRWVAMDGIPGVLGELVYEFFNDYTYCGELGSIEPIWNEESLLKLYKLLKDRISLQLTLVGERLPGLFGRPLSDPEIEGWDPWLLEERRSRGGGERTREYVLRFPHGNNPTHVSCYQKELWMLRYILKHTGCLIYRINLFFSMYMDRLLGQDQDLELKLQVLKAMDWEKGEEFPFGKKWQRYRIIVSRLWIVWEQLYLDSAPLLQALEREYPSLPHSCLESSHDANKWEDRRTSLSHPWQNIWEALDPRVKDKREAAEWELERKRREDEESRRENEEFLRSLCDNPFYNDALDMDQQSQEYWDY